MRTQGRGVRSLLFVLVFLVAVPASRAGPPLPDGLPAGAQFLGARSGQELWFHRSGVAWFFSRADLEKDFGPTIWAAKRALPTDWAVIGWHGPQPPDTVTWVSEHVFAQEPFRNAGTIFDTSCNGDKTRSGNARQLSRLHTDKRFLGFDKGLKSKMRVIEAVDVLKVRGVDSYGTRQHPSGILREFMGGEYLGRPDPRTLFPRNVAFERPNGTFSFGRAARIPPTTAPWVGMEWGAPHPTSYVPEGPAILSGPSRTFGTGLNLRQALRWGNARISFRPGVALGLLASGSFAMHARRDGVAEAAGQVVPGIAIFETGMAGLRGASGLASYAGLARTAAAISKTRVLVTRVAIPLLVLDLCLMTADWIQGTNTVENLSVLAYGYLHPEMFAALPPAADLNAYYD